MGHLAPKEFKKWKAIKIKAELAVLITQTNLFSNTVTSQSAKKKKKKEGLNFNLGIFLIWLLKRTKESKRQLCIQILLMTKHFNLKSIKKHV